MKKTSAVLFLCGALSLIPLLGGCVAAIGNKPPDTGTTGQQLIDLKRARETGAMTEEEYQNEKAKVLGKK